MKIIIKGVVPMLNGKDGMLRGHWSKRKKLKDQYYYEILSQKPDKFEGKVKICLTRYGMSVPDPDNVGASGKLILDALVMAKVIQDDSMDIVTDYTVKFCKCKRKEQRTEVSIEPA